jgi:NADH-quinone oxidoreductase subunit L
MPLLLFCGALGKSAQLPLHVWLPDAMEGPTPVSALIHAATMVAAGIYMLCRINFLMVPDALEVIMLGGTATALYAALCAITQRDIKKVLAYSTLSQLGYMVAAFGLGSLSVAHGDHSHVSRPVSGRRCSTSPRTPSSRPPLPRLRLGHPRLPPRAGHLQDGRPGAEAAGDVPTFTDRRRSPSSACRGPRRLLLEGRHPLPRVRETHRRVFALLALTAVLTSFYMVRLWKLTFLGAPRSDEADHAHEGGVTLTAPLVVLGLLSVVGGYGWFYSGVLQGRFDGVIDLVPVAHGPAHIVILGTSLAVLLVGAGAAWVVYAPARRTRWPRSRPACSACWRR